MSDHIYYRDPVTGGLTTVPPVVQVTPPESTLPDVILPVNDNKAESGDVGQIAALIKRIDILEKNNNSVREMLIKQASMIDVLIDEMEEISNVLMEEVDE